jgi:hypothetical protein
VCGGLSLADLAWTICGGSPRERGRGWLPAITTKAPRRFRCGARFGGRGSGFESVPVEAHGPYRLKLNALVMNTAIWSRLRVVEGQ